MSDLVHISEISWDNINENLSFDEIYGWIENNQFTSFYKNNKKYFFFAIQGRIYWLSEWTFGLIIFTMCFFGTVGIRAIFKKYKISKKIREKLISLIKKLKIKLKTNKVVHTIRVRGGSVEDEILHYEMNVPETLNDYFPIILGRLNAQESLVKGILKKCLRPKHYYKITHRGLLEIIEKMMKFKKKDSVRIISYDVLILALWNGLKPMSPVIFEGTGRMVEKLGYGMIAKHAPLVVSLLFGIGAAFSVNLALLNNGGLTAITRLLLAYSSALPGWAGFFSVAQYSRNLLAIDCTDYFEELPVRESNSLSYGEPLEEITENSKISVAPSKPTRHEAFASTAPGETLYYEERKNMEIETLDGTYKERRQLNGRKVTTWKSDSSHKKHKVTESSYIPLADRTSTLENVRDLDSTIDRESVYKIRDQIRKEQLQCRAVDDFVE